MFKDPGHVMVNTQLASQADADAVLTLYLHDPKIKRATELIGTPPADLWAKCGRKVCLPPQADHTHERAPRSPGSSLLMGVVFNQHHNWPPG